MATRFFNGKMGRGALNQLEGNDPLDDADGDGGNLLLQDADSDDRVAVETGIAPVDDIQNATGVTSTTKAASLLVGFIPGYGSVASVLCDGEGACEDSLVPFEKMLVYSNITEPFRQAYGRMPTAEDLRDLLMANNSTLEENAEQNGNFEDGIFESAASLAGGSALAYLVPGGGLLLGGAKVVAGGMAGAKLARMGRGADNHTNVPALVLTAAHYEKNGGRKTSTYHALMLALTRLTEEEQAVIEDMLSKAAGKDMTLEGALVKYIKGEDAIMHGGKPSKDYEIINAVMNSNGTKLIAGEAMDVDMELRCATGVTAGREQGHRQTLCGLYAQDQGMGIADVAMGDEMKLNKRLKNAAAQLRQNGVAYSGNGQQNQFQQLTPQAIHRLPPANNHTMHHA